MDVVILAAGLGSRFGMSLPKCLVPFRGKTLLQRQIEMILAACPSLRPEQIHVVTGYKHQEVAAHVAALGGKAHLIVNPFFECAGILGSAWLTLPHIGSDRVFRLDADIL